MAACPPCGRDAGQTLQPPAQVGLSCEQLSALNTSPRGRQSFLKLTDRAASLLAVGLMPVRSPDLQLLNCLQMKTAKTDDPFCVCLRLTMKPEFRVSAKPETPGAQSQTRRLPSVPLMPILSMSLLEEETIGQSEIRRCCLSLASFQSLTNRAGSPGLCSPSEARPHQAASLSRPRGEGCSGSLAPVGVGAAGTCSRRRSATTFSPRPGRKARGEKALLGEKETNTKNSQNRTISCLNTFMGFCLKPERGQETRCREDARVRVHVDGGVLPVWPRARSAWSPLISVPSGGGVGRLGPAPELLLACVPLHLHAGDVTPRSRGPVGQQPQSPRPAWSRSPGAPPLGTS